MTAPDSGSLLGRVRHRLAADGGVASDADVRRALDAEPALVADDAQLASLRRLLSAELGGAGPLEPLLTDPAVTDVLVNGPSEVWVDRGGGLARAAAGFADESEVRALAQRLAAAAGRLDDGAPFADAKLPDGTRFHAVLPPLTQATTISLRTLRRRLLGLTELTAAGLFSPPVAELLRLVVRARLAFVISGGTGTGKTTLLGALLSEADPRERIVIVEDAPELAPRHPHVVRMAGRPPNIEGAGEVGAVLLVRQALRMRPDRVVVGEFRGGEAMDLLAALNTGHEGGAATIHANSAAAVPARFEALGALAGARRSAVHSQLHAAVDVVLHLRRDPGGPRTLAQIGVLGRDGSDVEVRPAWTAAEGELGGWPRLRALLGERGMDTPDRAPRDAGQGASG
jgi:pilus assembly protein CpaF